MMTLSAEFKNSADRVYDGRKGEESAYLTGQRVSLFLGKSGRLKRNVRVSALNDTGGKGKMEGGATGHNRKAA